MSTIPAPLALSGYLRLSQVLELIPICKVSWYQGVKEGRFPRPVPLGARARGYRAQDIADLLDRLGSQAGGGSDAS